MIVKDTGRKKWFKSSGAGTWEKVEMMEIIKGDHFRGYTLKGKPLMMNGQEIYVATSDPYQADGRWNIEADLKKM